MGGCEPRQVRKEAAISGLVLVPQVADFHPSVRAIEKYMYSSAIYRVGGGLFYHQVITGGKRYGICGFIPEMASSGL